MSGLLRITGDHRQSPSREGSRTSLCSSLALLAAVLTSVGFALAAAPSSPAQHSTSHLPNLVAGTLRFAPGVSDSLARATRGLRPLVGTRHHTLVYL
ncbi:hypothetical protein C464_08625 [Halorubrum coriense DSM 10284]|uniref:Uncharacterized protein n=1 Tax=Halorubrum coriense DSM 10284 TaxID=1227466 RepID=M0EI59_9EURY|nr:hypothetical protein C464_08625 [Halorubrum coriense DSM 10284]